MLFKTFFALEKLLAQPTLFMIRYTLIALSTSMALLAACNKGPSAGKNKESAPVIVDVLLATERSVDNTLEVNGTILAAESVDLHPEVSGRLVYLNIPEGKIVEKGSVLARINAADLQAQFQKLNLQLPLAEQNESRLRKLLQSEGINQADYDQALNQLNSLKADISYTQALIEKTIIRAPFTGSIGLRNVSPGAYVSPATLLTSMQENSHLKVDFNLPQEYSALAQNGKKVVVITDIERGTRQEARIIAQESQLNNDTRNLKVRALLNEKTSKPGSFVKVLIPTAADRKDILVPNNAIIPDAQSKKLILVKNGKAVFSSVETGFRQANAIAITQGLQLGDSIVVSGVLFAKPDAPVQVRKVKSLEEALK